MINPTSESGAVRDAAAHPLAGAAQPLAQAAHPLAGADWAPLVAAIEAAMAAAGCPLPPGVAAQIAADTWRRLAGEPERPANSNTREPRGGRGLLPLSESPHPPARRKSVPGHRLRRTK